MASPAVVVGVWEAFPTQEQTVVTSAHLEPPTLSPLCLLLPIQIMKLQLQLLCSRPGVQLILCGPFVVLAKRSPFHSGTSAMGEFAVSANWVFSREMLQA